MKVRRRVYDILLWYLGQSYMFMFDHVHFLTPSACDFYVTTVRPFITNHVV